MSHHNNPTYNFLICKSLVNTVSYLFLSPLYWRMKTSPTTFLGVTTKNSVISWSMSFCRWPLVSRLLCVRLFFGRPDKNIVAKFRFSVQLLSCWYSFGNLLHFVQGLSFEQEYGCQSQNSDISKPGDCFFCCSTWYKCTSDAPFLSACSPNVPA